MSDWKQAGSATVEAVIEFLLVLIIVPPLITCALQSILALANIVLPWLALVAIVFIVAAALTIVVSARPRSRDYLEPGPPEDLPLLPPIDRPKAPHRRREDHAVR